MRLAELAASSPVLQLSHGQQVSRNQLGLRYGQQLICKWRPRTAKSCPQSSLLPLSAHRPHPAMLAGLQVAPDRLLPTACRQGCYLMAPHIGRGAAASALAAVCSSQHGRCLKGGLPACLLPAGVVRQLSTGQALRVAPQRCRLSICTCFSPHSLWGSCCWDACKKDRQRCGVSSYNKDL